MIHIQVPTFDEFNGLKFKEYKTIKLKNNPNTVDYNKITALLPGIPQGYCSSLETLRKTKKPIPVTDFYDIRQGKGVKKLKGYFITVLN